MVGISRSREGQINAVIGNSQAVASGYLRLLSLDRVRERMGPKWATRADQIRFIAEGVIKRHLAKGQTYYQASDSAYVIVFDFDVEDRAEHICRAIGREIVQRLLGESESGSEDISVEMRVTVVPCEEVRGGHNPAAVLEGSLAKARPHVLSSTDDDGRQFPLGAAPMPRAPEAGGDPASLPLVDRIRALVHVAEQQLAADPTGSSKAEAPVTVERDQAALEFLYLPLWTVAARAFLSYHLELRINPAGQDPAAVEEFMKARDDRDVVCMTDRLVLSRGLLDLRQSMVEERKYILIVPIHTASVLGDFDREHLLKVLAAQPEMIRRLVSLELIDARRHSWHELVRCIWALKSSCRQVIVRQGMTLPWLQAQHLPERSVGFSVALARTSRSEVDLIRELNVFVETAAKHRVESFIYGLRSRSLAFAAIGAGFNHVSGPAVAPRQKSGIGVAAAAMEELFARINN